MDERDRWLTKPVPDVAGIMLGGPKLDDDEIEVFARVQAMRKMDFGWPADFGED